MFWLVQLPDWKQTGTILRTPGLHAAIRSQMATAYNMLGSDASYNNDTVSHNEIWLGVELTFQRFKSTPTHKEH